MGKMAVGTIMAACAGLALMAADGVIGVAVTEGHLKLNGATVSGNANLKEGAMVTAAARPVRIKLNGGAVAAVGAGSSARVGASSMELTSGEGLVAGAASYSGKAMGFEVRPKPGAKAQMTVSQGRLEVGAFDGQVLVKNARGIAVALVMAGHAVQIAPAEAGSLESRMTGVLKRKGSALVVQDETTKLAAELKGGGLEEWVGQRIEVTGPARSSADGEGQVIEVAMVTAKAEEEQQGGSARPTSGQGGSAKPGTSAKKGGGGGGGMSAGAKVAIVALVAGGAAAGVGLAAMSR